MTKSLSAQSEAITCSLTSHRDICYSSQVDRKIRDAYSNKNHTLSTMYPIYQSTNETKNEKSLLKCESLGQRKADRMFASHVESSGFDPEQHLRRA